MSVQKIFTTSIRGLNGKNDPFACQFVRLGSEQFNSAGRRWRKADIFHGLGSPSTITVDAATLYIDKNCTVLVFAKVEKEVKN